MRYLTVIFIFGACLSSFSQEQIGQTIRAYHDEEWFGHSIAMSGSGDTVAVGAPLHLSSEIGGSVRVYTLEGNWWAEIGYGIHGKMGEADMGVPVELSADGSRLAVGYSGLSDGSFGVVRIYDLINGEWEETWASGKDTTQNSYGYSISLSENGRRLAISDIDGDPLLNIPGSVQVYEFSNNEWRLCGQSLSSDNTTMPYGNSVDLSADGNILVIGDPWDDNNGARAGAFYAYEYDGSEWIQLGEALFGNEEDNLGFNVSLSDGGSSLAVSAPAASGSKKQAGIVYVYDFDGSEWIRRGDPIEGSQVDEYLGGSLLNFGQKCVSLSGDGSILAIGAPSSTYLGQVGVGRVRLYRFDEGMENWEAIGRELYGENEADRFGSAIELSKNGKRLAVGAPGADYHSEISGEVKVYGEFTTKTHVEIDQGEIEIWPNPVSDEVRLSSEVPFEDITLQLYNAAGDLLSTPVQNNSDGIISIDLRSLPKGAYHLIISTLEWQYRETIVKQ